MALFTQNNLTLFTEMIPHPTRHRFQFHHCDDVSFFAQVPAGDAKKELLSHLDKVPTYVQTLQFSVKDHTVGKQATFVKVDHVIQETKNLMNVISRVVSTCFSCASKVSDKKLHILLYANVRFLWST